MKKGILKKVILFAAIQILWGDESRGDQTHQSTHCERKWNAETRLRLKATTLRYLGQVELFAPLLQNDTSLFFSEMLTHLTPVIKEGTMRQWLRQHILKPYVNFVKSFQMTFCA